MVAGRAGGVGRGGGGGGSEFNTYLFTAGPTQIYTSQPFSLHCNKKFIHAAGDHHGSRQNIRPYRTKIILNEGSNQLQQPYALSRYRADVQSDQDLGYELSCILQFIAIKTQLTLRQLAFLRLKIINPILYERQRVEKIGLFKPADSSVSSSETNLEPPSKKPKIKKKNYRYEICILAS
jgi:hypothetical protein